MAPTLSLCQEDIPAMRSMAGRFHRRSFSEPCLSTPLTMRHKQAHPSFRSNNSSSSSNSSSTTSSDQTEDHPSLHRSVTLPLQNKSSNSADAITIPSPPPLPPINLQLIKHLQNRSHINEDAIPTPPPPPPPPSSINLLSIKRLRSPPTLSGYEIISSNSSSSDSDDNNGDNDNLREEGSDNSGDNLRAGEGGVVYVIPPPPPLPPPNFKLKKLLTPQPTISHPLDSNNSSSSGSGSGSGSGNSNPAPSAPTLLFSCPVCIEDVVENMENVYKFACGHTYCKGCVKEHLQTCIYNGKARKLTCLAPGCLTRFPPGHLDGFISAEALERYHLYVNTPNCTWCPRPGCDTPMKRSTDGSASPQMICERPECGTVFCSECKTLWHEGMTCAQFKQKEKDTPKGKDELASLEYALKMGMHPCPNCGIWTEKIDGCEYVQCSTCLHGFCWLCLEPHDHNMGAHIHGSKYQERYKQITTIQARQERVGKILKYTGLGIAAVILGPPAIALGAAGAVLGLPVFAAIGIGKLIQNQAAKAKEKRRMRAWARAEKKRREDMGLPVSLMVEELAK